jgi:hypothetical protein
MILLTRDPSLSVADDYRERVLPSLDEDEDVELIEVDGVEMWRIVLCESE